MPEVETPAPADALGGLSFAQRRSLCQRTGLSPSRLGRLASGEPDDRVAPWILREVAEALGRPVAELLPPDAQPRGFTFPYTLPPRDRREQLEQPPAEPGSQDEEEMTNGVR